MISLKNILPLTACSILCVASASAGIMPFDISSKFNVGVSNFKQIQQYLNTSGKNSKAVGDLSLEGMIPVKVNGSASFLGLGFKGNYASTVNGSNLSAGGIYRYSQDKDSMFGLYVYGDYTQLKKIKFSQVNLGIEYAMGEYLAQVNAYLPLESKYKTYDNSYAAIRYKAMNGFDVSLKKSFVLNPKSTINLKGQFGYFSHSDTKDFITASANAEYEQSFLTVGAGIQTRSKEIDSGIGYKVYASVPLLGKASGHSNLQISKIMSQAPVRGDGVTFGPTKFSCPENAVHSTTQQPYAMHNVCIYTADHRYTESMTWTDEAVHILDGIVVFGANGTKATAATTLTINPGTKVVAAPASALLPTNQRLVAADIPTTLSGKEVWTEGYMSKLPVQITPKSGTADAASGLVIAPAAKINAAGTDEKPILFTGAAGLEYPRGSWGSLAIVGNGGATIPLASGDTAAVTNDHGIDVIYPISPTHSDTDSTDNSGILTHTIIANANTGLQLVGLGSGTTIEKISVIGYQGNGVSVQGGTVNISKLAITNRDFGTIDTVGDGSTDSSPGYGLDIKHGYDGTIQFVEIDNQNSQGASDPLKISGTATDPTADDDAGTTTPVTLANVTISATADQSILLDNGAQVELYNSVISRPGTANATPPVVELADAATYRDSGDSAAARIKFIGVSVFSGNDTSSTPPALAGQFGADSWAGYNNGLAVTNSTEGINLHNFADIPATDALGGAVTTDTPEDTFPSDSDVTATTFRGAVSSTEANTEDDWTLETAKIMEELHEAGITPAPSA